MHRPKPSKTSGSAKAAPRRRRLTQAEIDRIDVRDARKALAEVRKKGTISLAELKRQLGMS